MARLSQDKIEEIQRLYSEIGIYSQVAKQVGCSPSTVKKYCTVAEAKPVVKLKFAGSPCEISDINVTLFLEKNVNLTTLTHDELVDMERLWKEL